MTDRILAAIEFKARWLDFKDAIGYATRQFLAGLWADVQAARRVCREVCGV